MGLKTWYHKYISFAPRLKVKFEDIKTTAIDRGLGLIGPLRLSVASLLLKTVALVT